ncbi:transcription factor WER [Brachypodium distachyon]|uniref:Uncharacterized protein n=1 Tax=Brachypodium distachyon TaxID=15368 RepID=A0A0Q3EPD8_BRADI|nr:transcription factor WER [Brachypodium distachyon]KQJ89311.1 hypothetical protein BRADI_4g24798v3 [Brachypodium distachyon]|eukprot:XP_003576277.1 transcription factor WER [Brachypodium distachyon]
MADKPGHVVSGEATAKERKGLWSREEDELLYARITLHGVSTWSSVAQLAGLRRNGKSCRLRWMNYLRPDLKKERISKREEETIISLQKSLGNRWSVIAARMPGRTDNEIKNYWNSYIRKRRRITGAETHELAVAMAGEKEQLSAAPPAVPLPPPLTSTMATTQSTTTHEHNGAGSESEESVVDGGGEELDMDMIGYLLSFDDLELEYPVVAGGDLLMDEWESQLYSCDNSGSSVD